MIFPINTKKNGVDEQIGTVVVEPDGSDYVVTFYLVPGHAMSNRAKDDLESQLKNFMRKRGM